MNMQFHLSKMIGRILFVHNHTIDIIIKKNSFYYFHLINFFRTVYAKPV